MQAVLKGSIVVADRDFNLVSKLCMVCIPAFLESVWHSRFLCIAEEQQSIALGSAGGHGAKVVSGPPGQVPVCAETSPFLIDIQVESFRAQSLKAIQRGHRLDLTLSGTGLKKESFPKLQKYKKYPLELNISGVTKTWSVNEHMSWV